MKFIQNNLANSFTLANLFFGCVACINIIENNIYIVLYCIIMSLILDFLDGFVARATKTSSLLGGQLDSLADMISFGFLPGLCIYKVLSDYNYFLMGFNIELKYFGLIITLFSCLRLAIFNLDDEQTYYFKGLNTPTNSIFIFSLYYFYITNKEFSFLMESPLLLIFICVILSLLLVSKIKMIALKFKTKKIEDNYPKLALLIGIILLLIVFKTLAIPFLVIYYIFISLFFQKQL